MTDSIDSKAFHALSYGLYIITSRCDGKPVGCVVNTFAQVTSSPAQVSVAVNKENYTCAGIGETGVFEAVALTQEAPMELIGTFGFHSSQDTDKFAEGAFNTDDAGIPYPAEYTAARFMVRVKQTLDVGSHMLFVGEVIECQANGGTPMTYAYYHQVKGGKTPPKASSFNPDDDVVPVGDGTRVGWKCTICGHIEWVDELPDDFECPVCGVGKDMFERIEE